MIDLPISFSASKSSPQACSFDVFNTVLTRAVAPPSSVFVLVAKKARSLFPDNVSCSQFIFLREEASRRAHQWHGGKTTLTHIYQQLQESLEIPSEVAEQIKHIELDVEKSVLRAVPEVRSTIHALRDGGASILFVSDMYLPNSFIRDCLIEHNIWHPSDRLFVSHEYGAFKKQGRLFQHVTKQIPEGSTISLHVGDSRSADVEGAQMAGIPAYHFEQGTPNRYEQILGNYSDQTGGMTGLLAGASRSTRLQTKTKTRHESALSSVATGVLAPTVVGFVAWVLRQAIQQKLDRLYFSARDGYLLVPIARKLASVLSLDCEIRYLYLSRAAITAACPKPEVVSTTWDHYERASGDDLLARLGLTTEDIAPFLSTEEARTHVTSSPVTERGKQTIQSVLTQMVANSQHSDTLTKNRLQLLSYLEQERLSAPGTAGFVDIGWKGSIHSLLNDLLLEAKMISDPLPGFYFGLSADQHQYAAHRTAYFFDKHRKVGHEDPLSEGDISTVMEMFCTASHGTVTGFQPNGEDVLPVHESSWPKRMETWGFSMVEQSVHAFMDHLSDPALLIAPHADLRLALADLLRTFWETPLPDEAEAWGRFPRELGQGVEQDVKPLAEPFTPSVLLKFARYGDHTHRLFGHDLSWSHGSLQRSSKWLGYSIKRLLHGRKMAKRTVQFLKSLRKD